MRNGHGSTWSKRLIGLCALRPLHSVGNIVRFFKHDGSILRKINIQDPRGGITRPIHDAINAPNFGRLCPGTYRGQEKQKGNTTHTPINAHGTPPT